MTIKRRSASTSKEVHSLAELRQISARQIQTHNKLNEIIDVRQQELGKMRDSLYVEVQNFREAHQAEIRRSVEVVMGLAVNSLPWWKRGLQDIRLRAEMLMPHVVHLVKMEGERIKNDIAVHQAEEEKNAEAAKLQGEVDKVELERAAAVSEFADAPVHIPGGNGYGGNSVADVAGVDTYEVDESLLVPQDEQLTPVDDNV